MQAARGWRRAEVGNNQRRTLHILARVASPWLSAGEAAAQLGHQVHRVPLPAAAAAAAAAREVVPDVREQRVRRRHPRRLPRGNRLGLRRAPEPQPSTPPPQFGTTIIGGLSIKSC